MDTYGFPRTGAKGAKKVFGFQTGDMVRAVVTNGSKVGTYVGKVAVRTTGSSISQPKKTQSKVLVTNIVALSIMPMGMPTPNRRPAFLRPGTRWVKQTVSSRIIL
jgi:hypothetical protein